MHLFSSQANELLFEAGKTYYMQPLEYVRTQQAHDIYRCVYSRLLRRINLVAKSIWWPHTSPLRGNLPSATTCMVIGLFIYKHQITNRVTPGLPRHTVQAKTD